MVLLTCLSYQQLTRFPAPLFVAWQQVLPLPLLLLLLPLLLLLLLLPLLLHANKTHITTHKHTNNRQLGTSKNEEGYLLFTCGMLAILLELYSHAARRLLRC